MDSGGLDDGRTQESRAQPRGASSLEGVPEAEVVRFSKLLLVRESWVPALDCPLLNV